MYDVTREELMAAVEAEEREWLSTDDIHPYKSRVPQTKGNTVSFPKITKFNTYLLNHYSAEIVEEINGLLYDGELAAICGVDGFYSQQLTHDRCRIDPRMTFWRVNKYEFTADLVVYLKANAYNDDYSGLQSFTLYVSLDFCMVSSRVGFICSQNRSMRLNSPWVSPVMYIIIVLFPFQVFQCSGQLPS